MKKIFVTGADGFIGSHLVEKLVSKGYNVKALSIYNSFNSWGWLESLPNKILKEVEIVSGDVRDEDLINKLTKDVEKIFHLAALIGIPYSYTAPRSYIDTNVIGTLNVLNAAIKNQTKVIHTSTSEVYGTPQKIPINEKHRLFAQSPYAASKISSDQLALSYFSSFNLPVCVIRPFNTFGPRQSLRAIIPTIITQMLNDKAKEIKLGNTHTTRDFSYISDTVDGFFKTFNKNKIFGEVINLGTGKEISITSIVKIVGELTKKNKKIIYENKRIRAKKSEITRLCSSNLKAKKILKWQPKYVNKNGFKIAIKKTIDWYKDKKYQFEKSKIYNL